MYKMSSLKSGFVKVNNINLSGLVAGAIQATNINYDNLNFSSTTAPNDDSSLRIATTEFVQNKISELVNGAPELLNTLGEIADSINAIDLFAPKANPTFTGTVGGITKSMVGLGNVDNTSDLTKPISAATQSAINLKENAANKSTDSTFASNSDTKFPTEKAVKSYIDTAINLKAPINSPTFTGPVTAPTFIGNAPTATAWSNSTQIANTSFVQANKVSPAFTGIPTAPTATNGNNTTQIATTAFVQSAIDLKAPKANPTFTGTVNGITKSMVGLGNVDNTSDSNKPISTAVQSALDKKQDSSITKNYHFNLSSFPITLDNLLTDRLISTIIVDSSNVILEVDYLPQSATNTNGELITTTKDSTQQFDITFNTSGGNQWQYHSDLAFYSNVNSFETMAINFTAPCSGTLNMDIILRAFGNKLSMEYGEFSILVNNVNKYNLLGVASSINPEHYNNEITSNGQLIVAQGDQISLRYNQTYPSDGYFIGSIDHGIIISNLKIIANLKLNDDYYILDSSSNTLQINSILSEISIELQNIGTIDIQVNYPPTTPTAISTTNTTQIATTAFVQLNKVSPAFTGIPTAPTATNGNNTTQIATTEFVQLNKSNPTFTGIPTAPTADLGTNDTQIATTEFVQSTINANIIKYKYYQFDLSTNSGTPNFTVLNNSEYIISANIFLKKKTEIISQIGSITFTYCGKLKTYTSVSNDYFIGCNAINSTTLYTKTGDFNYSNYYLCVCVTYLEDQPFVIM